MDSEIATYLLCESRKGILSSAFLANSHANPKYCTT